MTTDFVDRTRKEIEAIANTLNEADFAFIPTSKGLFAIVDKQFENAVNCHRWYAVRANGEHIYAVADIEGHRVSLPRLIRSYIDTNLTLREIKHLTFANKCSFDCRAENLVSKADRTSVMRNRRPKRGAASSFKGVRKNKRTNGGFRWAANIKFEKDGSLYLGSYDTEKEAAAAYDAASFLFFEGSGFLNFPDENPTPEAIEAVTARYARYKHRQKKKREVN